MADWTVLDFAAGTAYSSEAIHFQAGAAGNAAPGAADKAFRFDGIEYSGFASVVASNFIAPDCLDPGDATSCDVDVEVLLFTLDGRPGDAPPQAARLDFYNDDERLSAFHGWIIHRFAEGATVLTQAGVGGLGLGGAATTVRVLSQGPNTNFGLNPDPRGARTN